MTLKKFIESTPALAYTDWCDRSMRIFEALYEYAYGQGAGAVEDEDEPTPRKPVKEQTFEDKMAYKLEDDLHKDPPMEPKEFTGLANFLE